MTKTILITDEVLDSVEAAIEPHPYTGVSQWTYFLKEKGPGIENVNTVDFILALVQECKRQREVIKALSARNGNGEDTQS